MQKYHFVVTFLQLFRLKFQKYHIELAIILIEGNFQGFIYEK